MKQSTKKTLLSQLILSSLCIASVTHGATPSPITVTDNGDSGANTLREAIKQANSNPGADVINIDASLASTPIILSGEIEITDQLTINGSGVTLDAGTSKDRLLKVIETNVAIDNLKLINGYQRNRDGGAIYAESSSLTISNAHFADNKSEKTGGAIAINAKDGNPQSLVVENSVFTSNQSRQDGGAIAGAENVPITIKNSYFVKNKSFANKGGAIEFFKLADGKHKILNSTFEANEAKVSGGVMTLVESELFIENSTFFKNKAVTGGAVFYSKNAEAGKQGKQSTLTVTRSTFFENTMDPNKRGAELFSPTDNGTDITLQNSIFVKTPLADPAKRKKLCIEQIKSEYNAQYNVMSDDTCGQTSATGNFIVPDTMSLTEILVGTLDDNGCKTKAGIDGEKACVKTMKLTENGPAIDIAKASVRAIDFDQRGEGFPRKIGPIEDAGALETSTITAKYDITSVVKPNAQSGKLVCNPSEVNAGGDVTCTATAESGYQFVEFEAGCDSVNNNECQLTNVQADKTVTAVFKSDKVTYNITAAVQASTGGSVTCTASTVDAGESASCTASPMSGYQFERFEGCDSVTSMTCNLSNIGADRNVVAVFSAIPASFSVTGIANPNNGGSVSCSPASVSSGGNSSCSATANTGYYFNGFDSGNCDAETGTVCTVNNITSNKQVTANFVRNVILAPKPVPTLSAYALLLMASLFGLFGACSRLRRT